MEEHRDASPADLTEDGLERGVADVGAGRVGEDDEAIGVEVLAAVRDFRQSRLGVGERQRRQQPEPIRVVDHGTPAVLVDLPGQGDEVGLLAEADTR